MLRLWLTTYVHVNQINEKFSLISDDGEVHLADMNAEWFKKVQKSQGVTSSDLARAIGRDRTVISHMYHDRRKMTFEDAKVFADLLQVPLADVLFNAGLADRETVSELKPGFAESDAAAWTPKRSEAGTHILVSDIASAMGGGRNGVDVWRVKSGAMTLAGYLVDDFMLVDTHAREECKAGDVIIAQVYDWNAGAATTILRRYQPPVLVAASANPDEWGVHVVDHQNVVIMGKVVASWRQS